MSSYYTQYSNQGATPWGALVDVVTHPIDSLRAFVGAPFALLAGTSAGAAQTISGITVQETAALPSVQKTLAEVVSESSKTETPTPDGGPVSATLPGWVKATIAGVAIISAVVVIQRAIK